MFMFVPFSSLQTAEKVPAAITIILIWPSG